MFFSGGWPVNSFPVTVSWEDCPSFFAFFWLDFHELTVHIHVGLFLGPLFCSCSLCVCVCASSSLLWLLELRDVVWSQRGRYLQLCSSLSEFSWPFKVLFNISSLILGIFLFLWKRPLNIILWLQSVYFLMALVGMDIFIPHCSSAWAWNSFLFICVFFGFFISAF